MDNRPANRTAWLRQPPDPQPGQVVLFCFPHSGAPAAVYSAWAGSIPGALVCPVEYPGHGQRLAEPLFTHIAPLVAALTAALLPYTGRPFAFFGHSMGALVSFELARSLRRHGRTPQHLFVSGHEAPSRPDTHPPIHALPEADFVEKIRAMNGTEDAFFANPELREVFLPILRADFSICETYPYLPDLPLDCPITAVGGLADPDVSRADLEAWQAETSRPVKVRMFPGDHFYLKNNGHLLFEILARELYQNPLR